MPWAFIPFLMLLSIWIAVIGGLLWNFQTLIIPVSAWIGYRYGSKGVKAVFYACIPLLLFRYTGEISADVRLHFGFPGGTLLAALAMAWLAAEPHNPDKLAAYIHEKPLRLAWLLFIPLAYSGPALGEFQIRLNNILSVYVALFVLGLVCAPLNRRHVILLLCGLFFVGIAGYVAEAALRSDGALSFEFGKLTYLFFAPQDIISAVLFLAAGTWTQTFLKTGEMPRFRFLRKTGFLLIVMMIYSQFQFGILPGATKGIALTGDGYIAILCCFLAGLFYQKRGFLIVLAPLLILCFFSPALDEIRYLGEGVLPAEMRFYIWTTSPERVIPLLLELFLWSCVGAQLRAWGHDAKPAIARGAPALHAEASVR